MTERAIAGPGRGRRPALRLLWLAMPALHVACFAGTALDVARSEPSGSLRVASTALGDSTLVPTTCVSGERQVFLGADLIDASSGITGRLILEPSGAASLRLFPSGHPLDEGLLFRRPGCTRFDLTFERTGWRINDVYDLRVRLDLDCRTPAGDSVQGEVAVDHCH